MASRLMDDLNERIIEIVRESFDAALGEIERRLRGDARYQEVAEALGELEVSSVLAVPAESEPQDDEPIPYAVTTNGAVPPPRRWVP